MATSPADRLVRMTAVSPLDETALRELFEANDVPAVARWFDPFPLDAASAHRIAHHRGADRYWGIWLRGELVGLAMVRGWDEGHPHRAFGILVDRRHAGQGLGRVATTLVLQDLRDSGEEAVRARVHDDNERSLRVLHACGFAVIERGDGRVVLECRLRPG